MGIDMHYAKGSADIKGAHDRNKAALISTQSKRFCALAQYGANSGSDTFRVLSVTAQLLIYIPAINHPNMPVS